MTELEIKKAIKNGAVIIDGRPKTEFSNGYISGALNFNKKNIEHILLDFIKIDTPLIIVEDEKNPIVQTIKELGYQKIIAILSPSDILQFSNIQDMIITVEADEFNMDLPFDKQMLILDVRDKKDYDTAHIAGAVNMPINDFNDIINIASIDEDSNVYIHCGGGSRSTLAASILKKEGIHNIRIIDDKWEIIKQQSNVKLIENKGKSELETDD